MVAQDFVTVKLDFVSLGKVLLAGPDKFRAQLRKELSKAGRLAGLKIKAIMRQKIREGIAPKNADMTKDIKGSTKSLVDTGRLFKAITSQSGGSLDDFEIRVGVKRSNEAANIAKIVHDGNVQTITRKQEVLFKMLWLASVGRRVTLRSERGRQILAQAKGVIAPLKEGQVVVIPPRPFGLITLRDPRVKQIVNEEFNLALAETFKKLK